jgi:glycosyltransferase involved in cell wall biosynthesis/mannosyltransferase OCH1-like enzyme
VALTRRRRAGAGMRPSGGVTGAEWLPGASGAGNDARLSMPTIGLCMIAKDEAHVILRCLESVRPLVDYVLIEDTGSTDGTQAVVRKWLERVGLPGKVVEESWQGFAYNRTHALARLRENTSVDYAFIMDADDYLVAEEGFDAAVLKRSLSLDMYSVPLRGGGVRYARNQICRNRCEFRYRGVLHEFLEAPPGEISSGSLTGFYITSTREGARGKDPGTYRKDTMVLEQALLTETDPFLCARYTFYLARSYRDCGDNENALKHFLARAELGHWIEEVFYSLYSAGKLLEELGRPLEEVVAAYLRASDAVPGRAEALHAACRLCRNKKQFADGYEYAQRGLKIPVPDDGLFLEQWVYDYGLLDELAVNAYWVGQYQDCFDACERLLREGKISNDMRDRVKANAAFAAEKLKLCNILSPSSVAQAALERGQEGCAERSVQDSRAELVQVYTKQFRIYRTIHIVWIGDEAKRPDNCIETWRQMNPGWSVRVWGNHELQFGTWANLAHMRKMLTRELCGVADMMRWEILEKHGGFAVDADSVCIRPLPDWLFEPEVFAAWENEITRPGLIANCFVYSQPGNALIQKVIKDIQDLPDVTGKLAWQLTGPQRLTDTVRAMAYSGITVYPSHYFMPEHFTGMKYGGSGPIFAKQLWGTARPELYESLAKRNVTDLVG